MRVGKVQARAKPVERAWNEVLREADASVHFQHLLRDTTQALILDAQDTRRIDVLATGLPFCHGRPLFCDATFRSPLHADGSPHPGAADKDGIVLARAGKDKRDRIYADVEQSSLAELIVLGCELGGQWNATAVWLIGALARHKVDSAPPKR